MSDVVLISGSPSASSRSMAILDYVRQLLAEENLQSSLVSVRDFPADDLILARYDSESFAGAKSLIAGASGLVVSTPVYKAAYSGALKTFLDILPQQAFRGKTVLPLASGGSPAHQLAIDYALKPVLSTLGATDLLQGVYFVDGQYSIGPDGRLSLEADLRDRLDEAVRQLAANVKSRAMA